MALGLVLETAHSPPTAACPQGHIAFTRPEDYLDCTCKFTIAFDREGGGRFLDEVQEIPGALAYGATQTEVKVQAVALHALAKKLNAAKTCRASPCLISK